MALIESTTGRSAEARLLIAQRELNWKQPWNSIKHNKNLLRKEGLPLVVELGRVPLPTEYGDWTYIAFGDYTDGSHHELLVFGNYDKGSLSRFKIKSNKFRSQHKRKGLELRIG